MAHWEVDTPRPQPESPQTSSRPAPPAMSPADPEIPDEGAPGGRPRSRAGSRPGYPRALWRRRSPFVWAAAGVVILLVGMVIGYLIAAGQAGRAGGELNEARMQVARLQDGLKRAQDRNWAYYRANEALKSELERVTGGQATSTTATDGAPAPVGDWGDGVYLVGEDITPGTYDGTVTGAVGYWARLRTTDGSIGSIITNGLPRGPFVLTIEPGDHAVELRGVVLTPR